MVLSSERQIRGATAPSAAGLGLLSERRLLAAHSRDPSPATREELIRRFLPFARGFALRYRGASESPDDLIQVASLGLVNAIDRYDPKRGTPFTAYAAPTILGELKRHFRDRVWTIRVPRGLHDRIADVDSVTTDLTHELQKSPSVKQIADRLGIDQLAILEVMEAGHRRRPLSLDRPSGPDDSDESSPSERIGEADPRFDLVEDRAALEEAIPHLDERERLVLRLRFVEDMTQSEIAKQIGHSQMHVSRILRKTLERIRDHVERGEEAGDEVR